MPFTRPGPGKEPGRKADLTRKAGLVKGAVEGSGRSAGRLLGGRETESMEREIDRLREELEHFRTNKGAIGPDHPHFRKWLFRARGHLRRRGRQGALRAFDQLGFGRSSGEMWKGEGMTHADHRTFQDDLEQAWLLLQASDRPQEAGGAVDEPPDAAPDGFALGDLAQATRSEAQPEVDAPVRGDRKPRSDEEIMERKGEPAAASDNRGTSLSARTHVIEQLMAELGAEMRSPSADWEKVQRIVGELMGLKKGGELVDRLRIEVGKPGAAWDSVRRGMADIWGYRKDLLIELLPDLLRA